MNRLNCIPTLINEKWEALPGVWKVNTDGAIFEEDEAYGIDIIIRDSLGKFIGAKSKKIHGVVDAHQAKAVAAVEGLAFARRLGIRKGMPISYLIVLSKMNRIYPTLG